MPPSRRRPPGGGRCRTQSRPPRFRRVQMQRRSGLYRAWTEARLRARPGRWMNMEQSITVTVNGEQRSAEVEPRLLLVHFLRETLRLTGTHIGCDTTHCGACTVLLDGTPVKSCTMFAVQADGQQVTTVEALGAGGTLHPIQAAFKQEHGLQCGFCTPGMMLTSVALLQETPNPTEDEIRWALSGNICRCTGYMNIVKAVKSAAAQMKTSAAVPEAATAAARS